MADSEILPIALTSYGLPHATGLLPTLDGQACSTPVTPIELMDAAVEMGLAGVDMPLPPGMPTARIREALDERNLRIVTEYLSLLDVEPAALKNFLEDSAVVGAKVARVLISRVLCGDRRKLPEGWEGRLEGASARLREALPVAEDLGLALVVENHQDATSDDLLRLYELSGSSPAFGICLDTGNPLAVGEGPVETARKLAPLIKHLHLKDYTIHFAPEGYRLVRCAAGDGCIDFPAILEAVKANGFEDLFPGCEIAAQPTRTIPLLEDTWWQCYPETHPTSLIQALRVLWRHGRPMHEPYSSAWERGADSATVCEEEWAVVRKSVEYFRRLYGDPGD